MIIYNVRVYKYFSGNEIKTFTKHSYISYIILIVSLRRLFILEFNLYFTNYLLSRLKLISYQMFLRDEGKTEEEESFLNVLPRRIESSIVRIPLGCGLIGHAYVLVSGSNLFSGSKWCCRHWGLAPISLAFVNHISRWKDVMVIFHFTMLLTKWSI